MTSQTTSKTTTAGTSTVQDAIDAIAGIESGDRLDTIRANRPDARIHAQGSFTALLDPADDCEMTRKERFAVAAFVSALHDVPAATAFYSDLLVADAGDTAVRDALLAEVAVASTTGPYGAYRGDLAAESQPGLDLTIDGMSGVVVLGERLLAALEHAHMLVFHPRDASRERLQALLDAGWSTTGIVTLSQLVAFLTFQIRVAHSLRVLADDSGASA